MRDEGELKFDPALSKAHRRLVHVIAEELRIDHESVGVEPHRYISVELNKPKGGTVWMISLGISPKP